jgi:hypothetical protein
LHLASSFLFILADGGGLLKAIVGAQAVAQGLGPRDRDR